MFLDYRDPTIADLSDLCFSTHYADHDLHLPTGYPCLDDADYRHSRGLRASEFCLHIILLFSSRSREPCT